MYQLLQECVIQIGMVWNTIRAFCCGFLKHYDVFIYQTAILYYVLAIYVCHI